jgi:translocator protein
VAFVLRQWSADRLAAVLFIPYAAWVGFATVLNAALWMLN